MAEFVMPSLGADMEAGVLCAWHKQPGDTVRRGDLIAEVETDKGIIEVEVFANGTVEKLLVPPGERVSVGTVLAIIREDGAAIPATAAPAKAPAGAAGGAPGQQAPAQAAPAVTTASPTASVTTAAEPPPAASRLPMSPSARRLARELGVDPATVKGTGHGGAITREDIERAAAAKAPPAAPAATTTPAPVQAAKPESTAATDRLARMRQTIAAAMSRSKREIPHYYLQTTIDLHAALTWLEASNEKRPVTERLLYGVLFLKAVALALRVVPELNAHWTGDRPSPIPSINVGVAISLRQGGLIAPALHEADRQSLDELMRNFRDLVNRSRGGGLRSSELSEGTITVTSLGEQGVESVYGVIYPPQVAIVGFGKIVERPWSVDGQVVSRRVVTATLSADHRVTDGHRGGLFLAAVDRLLQEPEKL